ncbi:MAG TPA: bifunctional metallophosphatase/5'-nucleotidase [Phycicoccus sp.]|nr:bifunctional metallophosphatase/5'-nucleotidase [Phycicoccus sp.]
MSHLTRRLAGAGLAGACAAALAATALSAPATAAPAGGSNASPNAQGPLMDIQILSFNDFHGNLQPPSGSSGRILTETGNVDAGGVEYLATHLADARAGHRNSITVAAGDLVGASPLLSAAFHDEPTIESMNALHLDASAVGNHEFDEGYKELQRLQAGGCIDDGDGQANQNSCPDGSFGGADFQYLAANVIETSTGNTVLPPYTIINRNGARIAFIGMTLKDTPNIVTASGIAGLEFRGEVETANALVPQLKKKNVNAIVVLVHEGGFPTSNKPFDYTCQGGGELSGPIVDIAKNLDPEIDMVITGHTHQPYVCDVKDPAGQDRLVTSASSFGRLYTDTSVTYDRRTNDIVRSSVAGSNMIVTRDVPKDPVQTSIIERYNTLVEPIAATVLGSITQDVTRTPNAGGESQLGDLIADAQLADPSVVTGGQEPVIAFMNPGGIRADLSYNQVSNGEAPGQVTFGEAFTVQPFNNYLVSMTMTGAQIKTLLTEQWSGVNALSPKVLQVSDGFAYTYSGTTLGTVTLDGAPIGDTTSYRIVTNNFLSDGGDGFPVFKEATDKYFGGLDIDAFANHLGDVSPYTPGPLDRITKN